jgi:hypothetical protein
MVFQRGARARIAGFLDAAPLDRALTRGNRLSFFENGFL